jgi:hypothetical protein
MMPRQTPLFFYQAWVGWLQSNNRRNVLAPLPSKEASLTIDYDELGIDIRLEGRNTCELEERTEPLLNGGDVEMVRKVQFSSL